VVKPDGYVQISGPCLAPSYKAYEHRYIWEQKFGSIPAGYEIHHIDGNRQNNYIENLEMIHRSKHHARDRVVRESMQRFLRKHNLYQEWLKEFQDGPF
jgi:hypothetical protein